MIYVLIGIVVICALAMVVVAVADDTVTAQPEPERPAIPAHRLCAVTDCPREWVTERHGWRLCHTHHRELTTKDGAA